jgi:hypothetical protein
MRRSQPRPRRMPESEIRVVVDKLADIARVLRDADPEDKDLHIAAESGNTEIKMILTGTDVYLSEPGLSAGESWMKLSRSALKGTAAASFGKLSPQCGFATSVAGNAITAEP